MDGLAGILAFIVWIVELPQYGLVKPFTPEGLMRFTDVKAALGMSTILMMTIAFLSVALVMALYSALRGTNLAFALFGCVLGVIGYIATALGDASTFFTFAPISDLYQAPAATTEAQTTAVLLWQATQGITHTFFFLGSLFKVMCFIVLGVIGVVGVVASLFFAGEIGLQIMGVAAFIDIIFLPFFGLKVYRLSRAAKKS